MRRLVLPLLLLALAAPAQADPRSPAGDVAAIAPPDRVARLSLGGGVQAAEALEGLLRAEETTAVRTAALHALAELGLRRASALERIRALAASPDAAEAAPALEALGRLGEADDMERLLEALSGEVGALRAPALRALRTLAGRRLSASPLRCRLWWDANAPVLTQAVEAAILEAEQAVGEEQSTQRARQTIARDGWAALSLVRDAAHRWLESGDHRLRAEAYHAIAALRLGDEAPAVADAMRFANVDDAREAHDAAVALGLVPSEGLREYARLADQQLGSDESE